jgi:dienelactone hydrolase
MTEDHMKLGLMLAILLVATCVTNVHGKVVTQEVMYQDGNMELRGYLAYDDAIEGKRPAVLVVHEWWGLNDYARHRAEQLAALGYVAFAVDMYGKGKVTTNPKEAGEWAKEINNNPVLWQQRALAGLEALKKEPRVDVSRIAAIGYCFGGATVQQLAYSGADLKGIVSFHGSLVAPTDEQAKQVKAKILICHGAADPLISQEALQNYLATMGKMGLDWQMVFYSGAKHSFTNPESDRAGMDAVGYSKLADQRSWTHMKSFFEEIFVLR